MNNDYIDGFLKAAIDNGLSQEETLMLYKLAEHPADPAAAGLPVQAGVNTPDPSQLGAGQPGLEGGPGAQGVPPELEQLIQSLPPEVLQQLIAEIEQEMGGAGHTGAPPQGHHQGHQPPPGPEKQGSALLCNTPEYQAGFMEAARDYGLTQYQTNEFYKQAVSRMAESPIDPELFINTQEKQASHYEGFITAALEYGCTVKQAQDEYRKLFTNN